MSEIQPAARAVRVRRTPDRHNPLERFTARRNARARVLGATLRASCIACGLPLQRHIGRGNRWLGCRHGGGR